METSLDSRKNTERNTRIIIVLLGIICLFLLVRGLYNGASIIIPFILAGFLLYILNPVIEFFERLKVPSGLAVLLSLLTISSVIIVLGVVINTSIQSFVVEFPKYEDRLHDLTTRAVKILNVTSDAATDARQDKKQKAEAEPKSKQAEKKAESKKKRGGGQGDFFSRLDKDGDGKISISDELPERMKSFGRADTNSDGFIDAKEMAAAMQNSSRQRQQGGQGQ